MLKIIFTTPQEIIEDGIPGQALFVICKSAELTGGWLRLEFAEAHDFVKIDNVKKVESWKA